MVLDVGTPAGTWKADFKITVYGAVNSGSVGGTKVKTINAAKRASTSSLGKKIFLGIIQLFKDRYAKRKAANTQI